MVNRLSSAARFPHCLNLHELNSGIEVRIGALTPEIGRPGYDRAFFQVALVKLASEIDARGILVATTRPV